VTSTERLPSRLIGLVDRIPESLESLAGPSSGSVTLPNRLAWSGPDMFDVSDPKQRLTLYTTLLDCGQLTSRRVIAVWQRRLPELAEAA